jgi:hypothetical protein
MSVDRLGEADIQGLAGLHDLEGQGRNPPKNFHGWYVFLANIVRSVGWQVKPQGTKDNEWHAEVSLPSGMDDKDAFKQHCQRLATNSNWKPRPMNPSDEEFLDRIADKLN